MKTYFYPPIDYFKHPAFVRLDVPVRADDSAAEQFVDRIDAALDRLHRDVVPDAAVDQQFASVVGPEIRAFETYLHGVAFPERMQRWIERAFEDVRAELLIEARLHNAQHHHVAVMWHEPAASTVNEALARDGVFTCHLDPTTLRRLRDLTVRERDRLRERAAASPTGRLVEDFDRYSDVGRCLHEFFSDAGILKGLSVFKRANVNFTGFALEYSHSKQTWWRGCYSDVGIADSRTAYMHYDHGCKNPKAIIPISEVLEENGPTCFVRGSHLAKRSNFVHFMIKSLDLRFYDDYTNKTGDTYYRRRFREPEHRREFLMLPTVLQACSHFGEDVPDDSPVSKDLLAREIRLTNDVGNCVVFDGDFGIHRGAMVTRGERFAFQVIFAIEPPVPRTTVLRHRARYLLKKALPWP